MSVSKNTVLVLEPGYADYTSERQILAGQNAELIIVGKDEDPTPLFEAKKVVAIMVRERRVTGAMMAAAKDLKLVQRYGVGVDNVDLEAATASGIYVANIPDYGAEHEVSDQAVALYLAVARRVVSRDRDIRHGAWNVGQREIIHGHRGETLGLVGFGRIARATAHKFRALGFDEILVSDPVLTAEEAEDLNVERSDLDTLFRSSQVISLHAPLTAETHHIANASRIAAMRSDAILINVSRGGLVDEAALADALSEGRIRGAGIDVLEQEPPQDSTLLLYTPNTVLSDHLGWYSEQSVKKLQTHGAEEVVRVLSGHPPRHWVNPWPLDQTAAQ